MKCHCDKSVVLKVEGEGGLKWAQWWSQTDTINFTGVALKLTAASYYTAFMLV